MANDPPSAAPRITIEPFTRQDLSLRWRLADAYYEKCGISAWTSGSVPFLATSNYPAARQYALLVTRVFVEQRQSGQWKEGDPFCVLEVGGGLGVFTRNFFRALETGAGSDGKELAKRIRYVFSDLGEQGIRQAMATPELRPLRQSGRLLPALFDMRRPDELRLLDGEELPCPLSAMIANYVCCVLPPSVVRRKESRWLEQYIKLTVDAPAEKAPPDKNPAGTSKNGAPEVEANRDSLLDGYFTSPATSPLLKNTTVETEWRALDLDARYADPLHGRTIRRLMEPLGDSTLVYPHFFVEMLRAFARKMAPGALVLVGDYGSCEREDLKGARDWKPQRYGNSVSHGINFTLFDALAKEAQWSLLRTRNPFRSIHIAALRFTPSPSGALRKSFQSACVRREHGEDLLDFRTAARVAYKNKEYAEAARLYRRCLRLDPDWVEALFGMGQSCVDAGFHAIAYKYLLRGTRLDRSHEHDFEFMLGRACRALERLDEALEHYAASLSRDDHPVTHANMSVILMLRGKLDDSQKHLDRALAIDPKYDRAKKLLEELAERRASAAAAAAATKAAASPTTTEPAATATAPAATATAASPTTAPASATGAG